jgi:hypothetical protein
VRVPSTADVDELDVVVRFAGGPLTGEIAGWKRLKQTAEKK